MKLTTPQMRVLTLIIIDPIAAQVEIDAKLSTRNVVTNLVKSGALFSVSSGGTVASNGNGYRVTDGGYGAAGIERPSIDKAPIDLMNESITVAKPNRNVQDYPLDGSESTSIEDYAVRIEGQERQIPAKRGIGGLLGRRTHGTVEDTRQVVPYRELLKTISGEQRMDARRVDTVTFPPVRNVTITTGVLPMPEIDPVDQPISYAVELRRMDQMDAYALTRAPSIVRQMSKMKSLMVGTGDVGSPTWHKNAHKATEDVKTGRIRCECNVVTKSRKLLSQLHKTTRIIPTVTEV